MKYKRRDYIGVIGAPGVCWRYIRPEKEEFCMAIASAMEDGNGVNLYNESGSCIHRIALMGSGPDYKLIGFTSTTVTIQQGHTVNTYNAHGACIFSKALT